MRVLLATLVFAAGACAPPVDGSGTEIPVIAADAVEAPARTGDPAPRTVDDLRAGSLAAIDLDDCAARGGVVRQQGLLGTWRCVIAYADAGKACRDRADCEGKCLLAPEGAAATGEDAAGVCQETDSPFGCYVEVRAGKAAAASCVD